MIIHVPPEANRALPAIQKCMGRSLLAVYLHGSAVKRGLRPHSDVDLLAVADNPMMPEARKNLAAEIMHLSGLYPSDPDGRRPLELIVFLRADLAKPSHPVRCEFIYGEWLRGAYEKGKISGPASDPEYTLILAQAREDAKSLFGPSVDTLLPVISASEVRRAIRDVLPSLIENLHVDERNVLLTLARMWRTVATGEFVPKDVAAAWAESRLSSEESAVLAEARKAYLGEIEEDWHDREEVVRQTVNLLRDSILSVSDIEN